MMGSHGVDVIADASEYRVRRIATGGIGKRLECSDIDMERDTFGPASHFALYYAS